MRNVLHNVFESFSIRMYCGSNIALIALRFHCVFTGNNKCSCYYRQNYTTKPKLAILTVVLQWFCNSYAIISNNCISVNAHLHIDLLELFRTCFGITLSSIIVFSLWLLLYRMRLVVYTAKLYYKNKTRCFINSFTVVLQYDT